MTGPGQQQDLKSIIGIVFEMDPRELSDESSPENTPAWDSLAAVRLAVALQEAYAIGFKASEIMAMRSIRMIRRVLKKKGITTE